jgi:sugar lactone lactonase YvrE
VRRWARRLASAGLAALAVLLALAIAVRVRYGGGRTGFPDLTAEPVIPFSAVDTVAALDHPPGNVAVSESGRVFVTLHPEGSPAVRVAELRDGAAVPFPSADWQGPGRQEVFFDTVLSLRIDRQGRLWTLDYARHGFGQPRLLAFDLATGALVHRFDFSRALAPLGSHLNDFQVDPEGRRIFIADASIFGKRPGLLVYDVEQRRARRLLEGSPSVRPDAWIPVVQGRAMRVFGLFTVQPGVDSIALDRRGEWLSFGAVTADALWRARAADLSDERLAATELERRVERFAPKTMSDGLSSDSAGNVYLTDPEHSAVLRLSPDRTLTTLLRDDRLRWPDGLGFGPQGWLYLTCSALHQVIGRPPSAVRAHAPYQVFRFRPGADAPPGH